VKLRKLLLWFLALVVLYALYRAWKGYQAVKTISQAATDFKSGFLDGLLWPWSVITGKPFGAKVGSIGDSTGSYLEQQI
jgi:hypothetical protein